MDFNDALPFLNQHHRTVVTTFRRSGTAQMSIVLGGPFEGRMALVARADTAKVRNLRRDPRASVLVVSDDWRGWVAVDGTAEVRGSGDTGAEELRVLLRDIYKAAGGDHSDWDEFDKTMRDEDRAAVLITPDRVSGQRYV